MKPIVRQLPILTAEATLAALLGSALLPCHDAQASQAAADASARSHAQAPTQAPAHGEPFQAAGISYAEAADFLARLQSAVRDGDAAGVAALTAFPLKVRGKTGATNRAQFMQRFASIYTDKVRKAILAQSVDALFANWQGLMIGNGEVWISSLCGTGSASGGCQDRSLRVTAVNN
jgi:hypothetical protein